MSPHLSYSVASSSRPYTFFVLIRIFKYYFTTAFFSCPVLSPSFSLSRTLVCSSHSRTHSLPFSLSHFPFHSLYHPILRHRKLPIWRNFYKSRMRYASATYRFLVIFVYVFRYLFLVALLNGTDVFLPKIYKKDIIDFEIETSVFPAQINGGANVFSEQRNRLFSFLFFSFFFLFFLFCFLKTRLLAFSRFCHFVRLLLAEKLCKRSCTWQMDRETGKPR